MKITQFQFFVFFNLTCVLVQNSNDWNIDTLHTYYDAQTVHDILRIPVRRNLITDKLIWTSTSSGQYTVHSGYHAIRGAERETRTLSASSSYQVPPQLWKRIWKLHLPPKLKIFCWNICHNALPTKDNLYRRRISPDPLCPLCHTHQPETIEHLFLLCPCPGAYCRRLLVSLESQK